MKRTLDLIKKAPNLIKTAYVFVTFFILLMDFLVAKIFVILVKIPLLGYIFIIIKSFWLKTLFPIYRKIINRFEKTGKSDVKRSYLISLAYKNLMAKKARSVITILGMSVGVGIIVLLLSLGYGIEKLIISRVASLEELKMIDISAGENTSLRLDKTAWSRVIKIKNVSEVIPLVSVVGRVNFKKATTDVLVYAASRSYLNYSKLKVTKGKLFSNNEEYNGLKDKAGRGDGLGDVAGAQTELLDGKLGSAISSMTMHFNILPNVDTIVWKNCSVNSSMFGYTRRIEGGLSGIEYWGSDYYPFNNKGRVGYDRENNSFLGRWIIAKVPMYTKDAEGNLIPALDIGGGKLWEYGCIQEKNIELDNGEVLGESTSSATVTNEINIGTDSANLSDLMSASDSAGLLTDNYTVISSDSAGIELISFQSTASATQKVKPTLQFKEQPDGEAVVSSGFLNLLNIPINKAVGTEFRVAFIIVKSLMPDIEGRMLTTEVDYKITGVIEDEDTTYFYIPFTDIEKLSIKNFSQLKVIVKDNADLAEIRKQIETFGFRTSSTVDTVKQIESLFANLRIVLAILGLVALGVASLGMFNTLTVSLLERTREIGGMKTMGMISDEVQDLFLAEAMVMGLGGGIGGLIIGFLIGKLMSLIVSLFAFTQGQGYLNLTYIPPEFTLFIIISSFIVGLFTGLYPAQRAKKISALNALRYE